MLTSRKAYIELIRRQIYGQQPEADAEITVGLCNYWLNYAIAAAAKQNWKDNYQLDGINSVNNSFYSSFSGIAPTKTGVNIWRIELPQIPLGIGNTEGISMVRFNDATTGEISFPLVMLSQNQVSYYRNMRTIPNKTLGYLEGKYVYVLTTIMLSDYTASVTMISGGDGDDLTSTINVPDDYFNVIVEYMKQQLMFQRTTPKDTANDGLDMA